MRLIAASLVWFLTAALQATPVRQYISLDGEWSFSRDGQAPNEWKPVEVPSCFQEHEGTNFHGIGWYRKTIDPIEIPPAKRLLLHFQAAATETEVWFDDTRLGSHLGGWTPFRFDITELMRQGGSTPHEIRVRSDEKVGHNTQGFLPVIAPHFGGLWQSVGLWLVPETYCDDLRILAVGQPSLAATDRSATINGWLRFEIPLAGTSPSLITNVSLRARLRGQQAWTELETKVECANALLRVIAPMSGIHLWSPAEPNLYEAEIALPGIDGDRCITRAAFRTVEAFGQEFRLNSHPLSIRGLLNWGYSAPLIAPNPREAVWRSELEFAKTHGFNLMKFCLWVPPQRYLELADELGVLTWMEYPTWHPRLTEKFLTPLRQEFREFFEYDRNHPSIILRSLTCETGPAAELSVLRSLYDSAHALIPGAIVEDDSSWISWNRVCDFYDDHPYGNNHTWVETLGGFKEYILSHGLKPLALGESTAADTWLDRSALLEKTGEQRPWWTPGPLDDLPKWSERMREAALKEHSTFSSERFDESLRADSLRYGLLMRKYQIEAFRREIPYGAYVISVIRDFSTASMGLLDYEGRAKWSEEQWDWQSDTMCLLETRNDRRSFTAGERFKANVFLSHFGASPIEHGEIAVTMEAPATVASRGIPISAQQEGRANSPFSVTEPVKQNPGTLARVTELDWALPGLTEPARFELHAKLNSSEASSQNAWPIWVVPRPSPNRLDQVVLHSSLNTNLANELFPGCRCLPLAKGAKAVRALPVSCIVVASHFDDALANWLEKGGRVLLLPDGQRHSLPLSAHWFLRGAPYVPESPLTRRVPRELLVELQHFDLAAEVVPSVPQLQSINPLLMLWDTHDRKDVQTHGIIFETRAGRGWLLVSALRLGGEGNAAGRWLLGVLLDHLRADAPPRHALPPEVWTYLKDRLHAEQTNLVARVWQFRPDPKNEGPAQGWAKPNSASDANWKDIRIGQWWESQGYPDLDGWAWYRLWVAIPPAWQKDVFLSFEGVDDIYELYINGELAGKGGDLATHQDALSEKKSHNITRFIKAGQRALIAVRVHDWYGAGGIFRPVTLGTQAFNPALDFLK